MTIEQNENEETITGEDNDNAEYDAEFERLAAVADGKNEEDLEPEPVVEPEPVEEVEDNKKALTESPDEKKVDEWASIPDNIKQKYEAIEAERDKFEAERDKLAHQNRSNEGRYKARERLAAKEHSEKIAAARAANPEAGKKTDPLASVREDYPEIVTPLEAALSEKDKAIDELRKDVTALRGNSAEQNLLREQQALTDTHPDWQKSISHPEFGKWVNEQPDYIQDVIERNNAGIVNSKEALSVIRIFEQANSISYDTPSDEDTNSSDAQASNKVTGKRNLQKKSASAPSSKDTGTGTEGPRNEFDESFEHFAKKADKANNGRP